jgi:flagellar motor protein MotB
MMNSISRLMAFTIVVAAMSAANSAHAQQVAAANAAPAACSYRSAAPQKTVVDVNKDSAAKPDSTAGETPVLEISREGLIRRTALSLEQTDEEGVSPHPRVEQELSSRPQACYPPAPQRKAVDR